VGTTVVVECFVSCGDRGAAACAPPVIERRSLHTHTLTLPRSRRAFELSRVAVHQNCEGKISEKSKREGNWLRCAWERTLVWFGLGLGIGLDVGLIRAFTFAWA